MRKFFHLRRNSQGAATVEFALLGPIMITMMMGVLQFGIAMWNYNSLRGIASDVARYAVINYQSNNKLTNSQLRDYTEAVATQAPYGMALENLTITVTTANTQRVSGATELTLTVNYNVPTLLSVAGVGTIPMSFSRPIFLLP
ncbi:pilus assembly protein [Novosphingobium sp. MW5]|nr:pilus assembly protein [Novosphingobium sp. MW5]